MRIAILYNHDFDQLPDDPAREARADVLNVARGIRAALEGRGHAVCEVPLGRSPLADLERLCCAPPEVAINLCESLHGDARGEALVPLALDLAGVPYTGSDALAVSLALHKPRAKEVLRARGVPTPDWLVLDDPAQAQACALPFPLIVKPSREDASSGIHAHSVVRDRAELAAAVRAVLAEFHQPALAERFVEGREFNVALFGGPIRALPIQEIDFSALPRELPPIVTYAGKWDEDSLECVATPSVPAILSAELAERVVETARAAFTALGCRDYGRVDLRLDAAGTPWVIDINPNCDLSPTAGFAKAAGRAGLDYPGLCEELVQTARNRHGAPPAHPLRPAAARPDARTDLPVHAVGGGLRAGAR